MRGEYRGDGRALGERGEGGSAIAAAQASDELGLGRRGLERDVGDVDGGALAAEEEAGRGDGVVAEMGPRESAGAVGGAQVDGVGGEAQLDARAVAVAAPDVAQEAGAS